MVICNTCTLYGLALCDLSIESSVADYAALIFV